MKLIKILKAFVFATLFLSACSLYAETELQKQAIEQVFDAFSTKMQDTYDIYWRMEDNDMGGVEAAAYAYYRVTIEGARELILQSSKELLAQINRNEKSQFPLGLLRLKITFQSKRFSSEREGSVRCVILEDNEITYFKGYSSDDIFKESYNEALKVAVQPESIGQVIVKTTVDFWYWVIDFTAELWVGCVWLLFLFFCTITGG